MAIKKKTNKYLNFYVQKAFHGEYYVIFQSSNKKISEYFSIECIFDRYTVEY